MDLNKEITEFKESFKSGGALTKTFLVFGFILSVSSLTSLSSVVIGWKGFILEALNFYQLYFVSPISSCASIVGLHYSKAEIHVATISSICVTVGIRLIAEGQRIAFRKINAKYNSALVPNMTMYWVIAIVFPIGIWSWYGVSDPIIRTWVVVFVSVFYPAFIVLPKLLMSKFGWVIYEKGHFSYVKSYYVYMAAIFAIIGSLAAVNSGLQESKPNQSMQPTAAAPAD